MSAESEDGNIHLRIEEEVLDMLRADPDLNVVFQGAVSGTSKRTPQTPNWQLALTLQEQLLQVGCQGLPAVLRPYPIYSPTRNLISNSQQASEFGLSTQLQLPVTAGGEGAWTY